MKKTFIITILAVSFLPTLLSAQKKEEYTLLEPLPCIAGVGTCEVGKMQNKIEINDYILYVYKFSIAIAVFLAIITIIWGGFLYITSEVPFIKSDGKAKITDAITGLFFVLVSYLILATIDPRLVNIDSNIPPIKVGRTPSTLADYQDQLLSDLQQISSEDQLKITELNQQIKDLQEQKADIDRKITEGNLAEPEASEAKKESEKLQGEITRSQIDKNVLVAQALGTDLYSQALRKINDKATPQSEIDFYVKQKAGTAGEKYPTDTENFIVDFYNKQIKSIQSISNAGGADIQKLERQRDFFVAQVKEEVKINNELILIPGSFSSTGKLLLTDLATKYQADLVNVEKQVQSGLSQEQYTKVIQGRLDVINRAVSP